jgi:hypothetical protein
MSARIHTNIQGDSKESNTFVFVISSNYFRVWSTEKRLLPDSREMIEELSQNNFVQFRSQEFDLTNLSIFLLFLGLAKLSKNISLFRSLVS